MAKQDENLAIENERERENMEKRNYKINSKINYCVHIWISNFIFSISANIKNTSEKVEQNENDFTGLNNMQNIEYSHNFRQRLS